MRCGWKRRRGNGKSSGSNASTARVSLESGRDEVPVAADGGGGTLEAGKGRTRQEGRKQPLAVAVGA